MAAVPHIGKSYEPVDGQSSEVGKTPRPLRPRWFHLDGSDEIVERRRRGESRTEADTTEYRGRLLIAVYFRKPLVHDLGGCCLNLAGLALGCGMGLETKAIYSIANEHEKHAFRFVFNAILNSQATGTATDAAAATVVTRCATSTRQCPGSRPSTRSNAQNPIFKFHMRKPLRNVASNAVRTLFGQAIPI